MDSAGVVDKDVCHFTMYATGTSLQTVQVYVVVQWTL